MPIQIKAPDGSIAQFPDGMADADIEKVMAQHYPQPSMLDRAAASPVGRFAHDAILAPIQSALAPVLNAGMALSNFIPGHGHNIAGQPQIDAPSTTNIADPNTIGIEQPYQGALQRNRNTPGYAAARAQADSRSGGSGFGDQITAPFNPALAGLAGAPGGFDTMNANADSQAAAQSGYAQAHPVMSLAAGVLGSGMAAPEGAAARVPTYASDLPMLTKLSKGDVTGPFPMSPKPVSTLKPGAQSAIDAGYTLPPRMITDKPGVVADTMAAWSGKAKTAQGASAKNQEVTNSLAANDLGLPADTVLTDKVFSDVRAQAGKAYSAIPKALPNVAVDKEFVDTVLTLGGKNSAAASEFPEIMHNADVEKLVSGLANKQAFPTGAGMELVKKLRRDASSNFRNPDKSELAFAQRDAANAIDSLIERNLSATGDEALVKSYTDARRKIAKSHDLEDATNTATGNVSARRLATLSNRGKPLSGGSRIAADAANAFPKALQSEAAFGEAEPFSVLDLGVAAASMHHNPSLLGAVLGRPLARAALLSKPVQSRIANSAVSLPRPPLELPRLRPASALVAAPLMLPSRQ